MGAEQSRKRESVQGRVHEKLSRAASVKSEQSCVDENEQSHMCESVQGRVRENAQKRHRHKSETVVRAKVGCGNRMFMVKYR